MGVSPDFVTFDDALEYYAAEMGLPLDQAAHYLRDPQLLHSALARPQHAAYYAGADLVGQAATLLWGLVRNHPFVDGNKRAAYLITMTFLRTSGWDTAMSTDEEVDLVVAAATVATVDDIDALLREHLVPFEDEPVAELDEAGRATHDHR